MGIFEVYHPLFNFFLLNVGYAFSQQIVLRAGVFSVATGGFAALGAYCTAILVVDYQVGEFLALAASLALGMLTGLILSWPLARLRGVYQAIATLAFVQIVTALLLYAEDITGGAIGINHIPRLATTWQLLIAVAIVTYIIFSIGRSGIGRAFDAIRQDETVAGMLGVSIRRYHILAFVISGAIGGLFGGFHALLVYSIEPALFGFEFLAMVLTFIVLGGKGSVWGPIIGTAIIVSLPEIARPLAENRQMAQGILMMVMIAYLPNGVYDSLVSLIRQRRAAKWDRANQEKSHAVAGA
ncbi:MAG: branched-chain amino acid ABC transporter permease [Rhizobiaceae bacterium]